jgi:hypothetical protein
MDFRFILLSPNPQSPLLSIPQVYPHPCAFRVVEDGVGVELWSGFQFSCERSENGIKPCTLMRSEIILSER